MDRHLFWGGKRKMAVWLISSGLLILPGYGRIDTTDKAKLSSVQQQTACTDGHVREEPKIGVDVAESWPYKAKAEGGPRGIEFSFVPFDRKIMRYPKPWLSAEEAVRIYCDYHLQGNGFWDKDAPFGNGRVIFLDVNFDGVLELLWQTEEGSACCQYSDLYAIDRETWKVMRLEYDGSTGEGEMCGMTWEPRETFLVANRKTAEKCYVTQGSVRSDSRCHFFCQRACSFTWRDGGFLSEHIAMYQAERAESSQDDDPYVWNFDVQGIIYGLKGFRRALRTYSEGYYDLGVQLGTLEDARGVPAASLQQMMLKAYKSFGYGKGRMGSGFPRSKK